MTASQNIRTPTMQLPVLDNVSDERLKIFCASSTRLTLSQIVDEVTVRERLSAKTSENAFSRQKLYTIRLALYPRADYTSEYDITPEQILLGIQRTFVPILDRAILKEIKNNDKETKTQAGDMGKARKISTAALARGEDLAAGDVAEDDGVVARDEGEEDDGDADDARRGRQGKDEVTYESDEDEDDETGEAGLEKAFADSGSEDEDSASEDESEEAVKRSKEESLTRMKAIERKIAGSSRYVDRVKFDKEGGEWCELELEVRLIFVGASLRDPS